MILCHVMLCASLVRKNDADQDTQCTSINLKDCVTRESNRWRWELLSVLRAVFAVIFDAHNIHT